MCRRSFTAIDLIILLVSLLVLAAILLAVFPGCPERPQRAVCGSNLRQIAVCLCLYANDNKGAFPTIPLGQGAISGEDRTADNVKPSAEEDPFVDIPAGADRSVSQNVWLLVRLELAQPAVFLCPSSPQAGATADMSDGGPTGPKCFVDFPWSPGGPTISYSFIQPWSTLSEGHGSADMWRVDVDPRAVLGADANDGSDVARWGSSGRPTGSALKGYVNSRPHGGDSQYVLYSDAHVAPESTPYVGIDADNIYTAMPAGYTGKPGDTGGERRVRPRDQFEPKVAQAGQWDTVLVPADEKHLAGWDRKP